jgi:hypothetical protein
LNRVYPLPEKTTLGCCDLQKKGNRAVAMKGKISRNILYNPSTKHFKCVFQIGVSNMRFQTGFKNLLKQSYKGIVQ